MNQHESSKNKVAIGSKPLFESIWLALFSELRRNYNDRHVIDPADAEGSNTIDRHKPGQKLN